MDKSGNKILAIIPARGGSKRIPQKNKKLLAGKELIRYIIESSLGSRLIDTIVVSTDDDDILMIAGKYKKITPLKRPVEISGDKASAMTYVKHALDMLQDKFNIVTILQPTSPFTLSSDIDNTISLLCNNPQADSAVSVMKVDHAIHPVKLKTLHKGQLLPFLEDENGRMAAYDLPELYVRNCSVYVSRMKTILKGDLLGKNSVGYVMPRERSLDINDPIDFEFAEFMMKKTNGNY